MLFIFSLLVIVDGCDEKVRFFRMEAKGAAPCSLHIATLNNTTIWLRFDWWVRTCDYLCNLPCPFADFANCQSWRNLQVGDEGLYANFKLIALWSEPQCLRNNNGLQQNVSSEPRKKRQRIFSRRRWASSRRNDGPQMIRASFQLLLASKVDLLWNSRSS